MTDIILPGGMYGTELSQTVQAEFPELPVLFMSGYPRDRLSGKDLVSDQELLKKPFSKDELQAKLSQALISLG